MWFLLFVINILIIVSLTLYIKFESSLTNFKRQLKFSSTLPGPSIREILPNLRSDRFLPWTVELRDKYGPLFTMWLGKDLFLFVSDPEDLKVILSSSQLLHKSQGYKLMEPWLGRGLLTNGGTPWHKRRKMLTPAFHFKILSAFEHPMEENCNILINKLKNVADGKTVINIYTYIALFALDVICETAMGIKKHMQQNNDPEYVKAVQTICTVIQNRFLSTWRRYNFLFKFTTDAKDGQKAMKILHGETQKVIELRRKLLEQDANITLNEIEKVDTLGIKRRLAFLDVLLIAQNEGVPITDQEIREEVDTFMFEGHDTTSSAISFTIYLLSQHPEIQERVYQEVAQEENQGKDHMKYLEAVIKESLRIYPSVPSYSRIIHEDFKLRELIIPQGITVTVLAYLAHRNPKEYPNPEKFDPERFLDGNKEYHPFAFAAFSAGPRNCIGQKFAMLELKCTLANLLRHFEFLPADDYKVTPVAQLVLKGSDGILVKARPRRIETP